MPQGAKFHFLKSDAKHNRVLLIYFETADGNKSAKAHLFVMNRKMFEDGVGNKKILKCEPQSLLPPWLSELEGIDLSLMDENRADPKILHKERVESRFMHIAPAINEVEKVLSSNGPEKELNRLAASCTPPQNETRFRLHFFAYLCFGRNIWVLLPPFHRIGHWDRFKFPEKKFGAPSKAYGSEYGNGMSKELSEQCVSYFQKRAQLGKPMTEIYEEVMAYDFKCKAIDSPVGMKWFASPSGEPFPTYWQFKYRVYAELGVERVQKLLYGSVRYRTRIAATKGSFTEEISNLMERVEADGYYTKEYPKGYIEGTALPPLCVVVGRDLLSGMKLGIGFSFGSERSTAYRMMLFSMAVPKNYFCSLFGIEIMADDWPSQGLPGHFAIDRGPGAKVDLIKELEKRFPIREMAPSYSGQSKATVESSHPKNMKSEGQPVQQISSLTPVEMAVKEIERLLKFNSAADMEERLEPDSELVNVVPSPLGLWNHYDEIFRNDAIPVSIEDAVRTFLTPIELSLQEDGVWLKQRRFDSDAFRKTSVYEHVSRSGKEGLKINGFILDLCVRHIWVEFDKRLYQLNAMLKIRGDEKSLYASIKELEQYDEARDEVRSAFKVHQRAVSSLHKYRFKENTGKFWDSAKRRYGKLKRSALSRQEEVEAKQPTSSRKAA